MIIAAIHVVSTVPRPEWNPDGQWRLTALNCGCVIHWYPTPNQPGGYHVSRVQSCSRPIHRNVYWDSDRQSALDGAVQGELAATERTRMAVRLAMRFYSKATAADQERLREAAEAEGIKAHEYILRVWEAASRPETRS